MKAQASYIASTVQHADDDGLGWGHAEIDIVSTVHNQARAKSQLVSWNTAVAHQGQAFQVFVEFRDETYRGRGTADRSQAGIDGVEIISRST